MHLQRRTLQQVLDNTALDAIAQQQLGIEQPTVEQGNSLVSTIMAAATAPVRSPGLPSGASTKQDLFLPPSIPG